MSRKYRKGWAPRPGLAQLLRREPAQPMRSRQGRDARRREALRRERAARVVAGAPAGALAARSVALWLCHAASEGAAEEAEHAEAEAEESHQDA